jgi:DNA-binding winged helix-turn-helix (wHTH) protein/tetratricopeptide (TPR) repeat protein
LNLAGIALTFPWEEPAVLYRFETFFLDDERRELRRGAETVELEPQVFDVLLFLIQHRDRVVSKDELIAQVWAGRLVSESTVTSRITAVRHAVDDSGARQRLIRTLTHKGYRFVAPVQATLAVSETPCAVDPRPAAAHSTVDTPSIAVRAFTNLALDVADQHAAGGVVEDIITELTRLRWLRVSAGAAEAHSTRYLLEGSVRSSGARVRIVARLLEAETGTCLWAGRFDGRHPPDLALQDRVTTEIVGALVPRLERAEIERALRKPLRSLDARDLCLRGMASLHRWDRAGIDDALRLFQGAIQTDPEFAAAYGMAAYCYVQRQSNGWLDVDQDRRVCASLAYRAAELGKEDANTLAHAAHGLGAVARDVQGAAALIELALAANPNAPLPWYVSGWIELWRGEPDVALEHLSHATRLGPSSPFAFKMQAAIAYAHLLAARYDEASEAAERALRARPIYLTALRGAAASYALAGRVDVARQRMARVLENDASLRVSSLPGLLPFRPEHFRHFAKGLRKAGLPE